MPANHVSEWFGHRVYPRVAPSENALEDQKTRRCPFLSAATGEFRECVKPDTAKGVCTISSHSNGPRQDWLVCPYRALDDMLWRVVVGQFFSREGQAPQVVLPAPLIAKPEEQQRLLRTTEDGGSAIVYFQDKLGGEISVSRTDRSPALSFDVTLVEFRKGKHGLLLNKYGVLEVQTMEFHGSYRAVVKNLRDALRLHQKSFHSTLQENQDWLAEGIQGPNMANTFKRTFYQMMMKFQIGRLHDCAGCVLALPLSVWESWQGHLAKPELHNVEPGYSELRSPECAPLGDNPPAWIYVFDIDANSPCTPSSIVLTQRIATTVESVAYFALQEAPRIALESSQAIGRVTERIRQRMISICTNMTAEEHSGHLELIFTKTAS